MALVDLIATSGARNFETMRKGWLPTAEETNARRMADLQIKEKQQKVAYEPTRQKLAKEESALNAEYKQSLMAQHKAEAANLKNTTEIKARDRKIQTEGMLYQEAAKLKGAAAQKKFLSNNKDKFFPPGTEQGKIDAFDKALQSPDDVFKEQFRNIRQGNTYLQKLSAKNFGKIDTYYNPNTKMLGQVLRDSPDYYAETRELQEQGYTVSKKLGIDLEGKVDGLDKTGKKLKEKKLDKWVTRTSDTTNTITGYGELINLVSSDDFKAGVVGDAISLANSITQQGFAIFGKDSILKGDGSIDFDLIDKDAGFGADIRRLAVADKRYASALMEMAYMKAKSLDKGGKVTDADYRFAKQMLDSRGDKAITVKLLRDNIYRLERYFNQSAEINNDYYSKEKRAFGKVNADKILGWGEFDINKNVQAIQQEEQAAAKADLGKRRAALVERQKALMGGAQ